MPPSKHQPPEPPPNPEHGIDFSKPLPSNLDFERFVLGSILIRGTEEFDRAAAIISGDDFTLQSNRVLWSCLKHLRGSGQAIDTALAANVLRRNNRLDSIGGLTYLVSLTAGMPDVSHPESYCKQLRELSNRRRLIALAQSVMDQAFQGDVEAPEIIAFTSENLGKLHDSSLANESPEKSIEQVIETYPGGAAAILDPTLRPKGLLTGITGYDEMTGGFRGGQVVTFAGRTSSGKSAWALNVMEKVAMTDGVPCLYFTYEMPEAALLNRLVASRSRVDDYRIRNNFVNAAERARMQSALYELTQAPISMVSESRYKEISRLCGQIRKAVKRGVGFVIVDHLGFVGLEGSRGGQNLAERIQVIMQRLKDVAMDLNIPILLLCQLKRPQGQNIGKPPDLEDLRDSDAIAQTSDVVAMIYRQWLHSNERDDLKDKAEIYIRKQREGPVGKIKVRFNGGLTRFMNLEDEVPSK